MFFEGKCKEIDRIAVREPGFGWPYESCSYMWAGLHIKDWTVKGILKDFMDLADKSFLDDYDDDEAFDPDKIIDLMNEVYEAVEETDTDRLREILEDIGVGELTPENHFGLVQGVDFVVALMDPLVKIDLRYDGFFDILPCVYGQEPDELRTYPIGSASGFVGIGADEKADALCQNAAQGSEISDQNDADVDKHLNWLDDEECGVVFEGIYNGKVRFVIISGSVVDYDADPKENLYQYLVDALKIESGMKIVFDEVELEAMMLGLWRKEFQDEDEEIT